MENNKEFRTFPDIGKDAITEEVNDYLCSIRSEGLTEEIEWNEDPVLDSEEEAVNTLMEKEDVPVAAVRFYDYPETEKSDRQLDLEYMYEKQKRAIAKTNETVHYSGDNMKISKHTCKNCGSSIATAYIKSNFCPVCGADLRPDSVIEKQEKQVKRLEELEKKLHDEIAKQREKNKDSAVVKWLVMLDTE